MTNSDSLAVTDHLPPAVDPSPPSLTTLRGRRPEFTDDPMLDRLYSITIAAVSELMVTRSRLDTLERLLAAKNTLTQQEMEDFIADDAAKRERGELQQQILQRIFREL